MKNRFYLSAAAFLALSSCAFAQATYTWDPDADQVDNGGNGTWDTATANWDDDASAPNVAWSSGFNATFGSGSYQVDVNDTAGVITVGDLTYGGGGTLEFRGSTALGTVGDIITIKSGGATWDTGDGQIEFFNDGNNNNTLLSMTSGDTLTVNGGGEFDTGQNPQNNANGQWDVSGATLAITEATVVRGQQRSTGQFGSVELADGSIFVQERNADQTLANDWVLNGTQVSFGNRFNRKSYMTGVISGDARLRYFNGGNYNGFLRLDNSANTFTGGIMVDRPANNTLIILNTTDGGLGAVPGAFDEDNIILKDGGALRFNVATTIDANRGITLDGGGMISANGNISIDGVIAGDGGLQFGYGGGPSAVLTLNNTSTYTGETWLFEGNLVLGATNALGQGVLKLGGTEGFARLILFDNEQTIGGLYNTGSKTKQIVNRNSATAGSTTGTLTFDVADGESYSAGQAVGVNATDDRGNFNIVKDGLGSQTLTNVDIGGDVTVNEGVFVMGGAGVFGNASVTGGTLEITGSSTGTSYATSAGGTLQIGNGATAGSINDVNVANEGTVNFNRSDAVTYAGAISGGGGIQLNGGVTLTLSGVNTFTGNTEVIDGTLIAPTSTSLPDYSAVDVAAGEIFMVPFDGVAWTSAAIADAGGLSTTVNWLDTSAYLGLDISAGSISLDHDATGAHSLWLQTDGGDVLTFSTSQSYTGNTYIERGKIQLTASDRLPSTTVLTLAGSNGGTSAFQLNSFDQTLAGLASSGSNTKLIENDGGTASTLTINVGAGESYSYNANISESGGGAINIVKNGDGTQSFDRNSNFTSYTGTLDVNAGTLGFRFPAPIDPATQAITVASGATFRVEAGNGSEWLMADIDDLFTNATFNAGSFLGVQSWVEAFDYTSNITGDIGLVKSGDSTLTLSGTNDYTGKTVVEGSYLVIDDEADLGVAPGSFAADHLTLDGGGLQAATNVTIDDANRGITLGSAGGLFANELLEMTIAAPITGAGSLTLDGAGGNSTGFLEFTGTNTYTGETVISQGSLKVSSTNNLPDASNLRLNGVGILLIDGDLDGVNAADFTRSLGTDAGEIQFTNGGGFSASSGDRRVNIGGAGADLEWGVGGFMPETTPSGFTFFLASPEATHTLTLVNGLVLPGTANYGVFSNDGAADVDAVISGDISGTGGLRVRGSGTLALEGTNTYSGVTNIEADATLLVNGDNSGATGNVTVVSTATLGGTGTVGGAVTVQSGGTITAGASAGTLTVPSLTLNDGAEVIVEIDAWNGGAVVAGTDSDLVVVTGALTVDPGTVTIVIPSTPGDFTETSASFDIVTFGSESGLGAATINVDDTAWTGTGTWAVTADLDSVILEYTAPAPSNPYDTWAGGVDFDVDTNGDGVDNGLAWILGATDEDEDALALLPDGTASTGDLVMTFTIVDDIDPADLFVEYSSDLSGWTQAEVLVSGGVANYDDGEVNIDIAAGAAGFFDVTATISPTVAVDELFGRLSAIEN